MKRSLLILTLLFSSFAAIAQTINFDILSFKLPDGWKLAQQKENVVQYQKIIGSDWGQINIYRNTSGKGTIQDDLLSEWKELVLKNYDIKNVQQASPPLKLENGWQKISETGYWVFNGKAVTTQLTTFSGNGACISVVGNTTKVQLMEEYVSLINSILIVDKSQNSISGKDLNVQSGNQFSSTTFKYNQTNFDDGWVSYIKENWVEVSRSNVRVLLHFPKNGTIFPAQPDVLVKAAWNILVAPRYREIRNFKAAYVEDFQRPYFATATALEVGTGNEVFITLFRRSSGWIEVITPNSNAFAQLFGFKPETIRWGTLNSYMGGWVVDQFSGSTVEAKTELFDQLDQMQQKNRFAVDVNDLNNSGEWNDQYSSNTFYTDYFTGAHAGISTYSSSQSFIFGTGFTYRWNLVATNSFGGSLNVAQGKGKGTFKSLNNWQLYFSDLEGKPKKMDVYFSAIKGGRILWMNDAQFPGNGIFTGYSKK